MIWLGMVIGVFIGAGVAAVAVNRDEGVKRDVCACGQHRCYHGTICMKITCVCVRFVEVPGPLPRATVK